MKCITIFFIILLLPTFLLGQDPPPSVDTLEVTPLYKKPNECICFTIPKVKIKNGEMIRFKATEKPGFTFIIPKADSLFAGKRDYYDIGGTKFLIFFLEKGETKEYQINENANPYEDGKEKEYRYAIYWNGLWPEGESSPVIIIEPEVE